MNDDTEDECPGCGSSHSDRQAYQAKHADPKIPLTLKNCPHCGTKKCCMCDMGDDTDCISCGNAGEEG